MQEVSRLLPGVEVLPRERAGSRCFVSCSPLLFVLGNASEVLKEWTVTGKKKVMPLNILY